MSALIFTLLLHLFATLPSPTNAGLTIGSVSSTSTCYDALTESSGDDNLVDKDEYVTFINILSDDFFTYPQYNPETNEYGNLPVSEFFQLPIELQMNFNTLACGGAFVSCPNAYLVTDGAGSGETPTDQQTIYLYEVCSNTEESIDDAKAAVEEAEKLTNSPVTDSPVKSPAAAPSISPTVDSLTAVPSVSPTVDILSNTVEYYSEFQYQIQVSEGLTASAVMKPTHQMNIDLVTGMNDWSAETCEEWNNMTVSRRRLRGRRLLAVTTELNPSIITNVTDVACNKSTKANVAPSTRQWLPPGGDHCLLITQGQTYYLTGNTSEEDIFVFLSSEFDKDIEDGSYLETIPEPSRSEIRTIYPSGSDDESSPPDTGAKPNPPPSSSATVDTITPDEPGGSNTAAIAAGVSVSLLVIVCALFVARRRMMSEELKDDELESVDGDDKNDSDSSSYSSGSSGSGSSSGSSSSGSYSSNSTSDNSKSYYSNSGSTSGAGTSVTGDGPVSVSASESDSHSSSHPRQAPKIEESKARVAVVHDILDSANVHDSMDSGSSVGEASLVEEAAIEEIDSDSDHGSHSDDDNQEYEMNVDLTDAAGLEVPHMDRHDSSSEGDSSAGSSGWNSSPGDSSSTNTESVESFDPNMVDLGSSTISKTDADESDEYALDRELLPGTINPAVNPVIQPQVSMLPVDEDDSAFSSDDSDYSASSPMRSDAPPLGHEIQAAIDQGDWSAVGATAAILAPEDPSPTTSEMDTLVNSGNWSGIVAVAAKYADDASIQSGPFPSDHGSQSSRHRANSISSASVESADDSYWTQSQSSAGPISQISNATDVESSSYTGSNYSNASFSATGTQSGTGTGSSYVTGISAEGLTSEISGERTQPSSDRLSSLTSNKSHHEQSASTSSSAQNKQRIDEYRSEVEALVRRVVPDEIDNVDSIMVQFSGREEELIATLRGMQEKTIAQRAKAAVQRSAKKEAKTGGRISDDYQSSEASSVRDSYTTSAASVDAPLSMASTNNGSITEEFADDDSESGSENDTYTSDSAYGTEEGSRSEYSRSEYSSVMSHSASEYTSRSESGSSGYSSRQSQGLSQDVSKETSEGLMNDMMDTGDWDGIVSHARTMRERASEQDLD